MLFQFRRLPVGSIDGGESLFPRIEFRSVALEVSARSLNGDKTKRRVTPSSNPPYGLACFEPRSPNLFFAKACLDFDADQNRNTE
jgi:hypothetical protein